MCEWCLSSFIGMDQRNGQEAASMWRRAWKHAGLCGFAPPRLCVPLRPGGFNAKTPRRKGVSFCCQRPRRQCKGVGPGVQETIVRSGRVVGSAGGIACRVRGQRHWVGSELCLLHWGQGNRAASEQVTFGRVARGRWSRRSGGWRPGGIAGELTTGGADRDCPNAARTAVGHSQRCEGADGLGGRWSRPYRRRGREVYAVRAVDRRFRVTVRGDGRWQSGAEARAVHTLRAVQPALARGGSVNCSPASPALAATIQSRQNAKTPRRKGARRKESEPSGSTGCCSVSGHRVPKEWLSLCVFAS